MPGAGPGVLQRDKEVQPSLRFIYTAPVALPGDPGDNRGGCRVLGAQHHGGCHRLWRFWSPRIPAAGQGWDLPEGGEAEHPGQPRCWRAFSQQCQGRARPGGQEGHGGGMVRREQHSGRGSPSAVLNTEHPAVPLLQHEEEQDTLLPWTETLQARGRSRSCTLGRAAAAITFPCCHEPGKSFCTWSREHLSQLGLHRTRGF